MLIGQGWAFVHIPKCGGTTVRAALRGKEIAEVLPMFPRHTVDHRFHWVTENRIPGAFGFVRHPAAWLASYWSERAKEGQPRRDRYLDKLWSEGVSQFALRVALNAPGYVGELFDAYAERAELFRIEDGMAEVVKRFTGCAIGPDRKNRGMAPKLSQRALEAVAKAEGSTLKRYGYPC